MTDVTIAAQTIQVNPISAYTEQVNKGVAALSSIKVISNDAEALTHTDTLNKGKKLIGLVNKQVDALCQPLKDKKKEIDEAQRKIKGYADQLTTELTKVIGELEAMIIAYHKAAKEKADALRKKQEEDEAKRIAAQELINKTAEGLKAEGIDVDIPKVAEPVQMAIPIPQKVKGMTSVWKYEIIDENLVPRDFCSPDAGLINAAVKSGTREIAGVKIYEETIIKKS